MSQFVDNLTGPNKDAAVTELSALAEKIVGEQSGLSGKLVKGAYSAAKKVDANIVSKATARLLPDVAKDLDPLWSSYTEAGSEGSFGSFLEARKDQTASMLLETADRKVAGVNNNAVGKIYGPVRGKVAKIVEENVGQIGDVLEKHAR